MTPAAIHFAKSGKTNAPTLPTDAVTRTFGIFGMKDSGKTTTARVIAEGVVRLGGHVVVLDPVGVWWGITRAGSGPGCPGIVIGGEHGDVPLEETGGQLVAELVVTRQWPVVVIDMKLLRKGAAQRFMADFLEGVYFHNRRPLHLIFEEADRALPQAPRGMNPTLGRVMGAAEDIVKLGRSRGLGSTFLSQRMATVTKNVVEQVEALLLHRQAGPNDVKAVKGWIENNGDPRQTVKVLDTIASLEQGEAWLYSPGWLRALERVRMKMPRTLDSSSTPTDDEREVEAAAARAPVDLDELRKLMSETVERAEANDPAALRKRIAELEMQLEERPVPESRVERVLVPDPEGLARLVECVASLEAAQGDIDQQLGLALAATRDAVDTVRGAVEPLGGLVSALTVVVDGAVVLPREGAPSKSSDEKPVRAGRGGTPPVTSDRAASNGGVSGPQQRVLDALAWWWVLGVDSPQRHMVAMVAGYHERTKGFLNALSALKTAGYVEHGAGMIELRPPGQRVAEWPEEPGTDGDLHAMIFKQIGPARTRLLRILLDEYPRPVERAELARRLDYHERTKGFLNSLSALRSLKLIDYQPAGHVVALPVLFPSRPRAAFR